jgi:lipopolysaccharide/colanic/teichoic acid biosynthesis glycosyltransferase
MVSELLFLVRRIIDALEAMYVVALMSVLVAISIIAFFIARMGWSFYRLRGRHEVVCPDNRKSAIIRFRATHGAVTSALNDPEIKVRKCSRWPEKSGCDEACVRRKWGFRSSRTGQPED